MQLDAFRRQENMTYTDLARRLGAAEATVARRWCLPAGAKGRAIPNEKFMLKIIEVSHGEVLPNDFYLPALIARQERLEAQAQWDRFRAAEDAHRSCDGEESHT